MNARDKQLILGEEMSYLQFKESLKTIDIPIEKSNHSERVLYEDTKGRTWLWDFYKEVGFSGKHLIYEHFFLLPSHDAISITVLNLHIATLKNKFPFLFVGPDSCKVVHFGIDSTPNKEL